MAHLFGIPEHVAVNCDMQYYIRGKNYVVKLVDILSSRHVIYFGYCSMCLLLFSSNIQETCVLLH
jgi:hypothetical protein